jgi:hypothetical protein
LDTQIAREAGRPRLRERRSARAAVVLALGPLTALAGVVWAIAQPWRITLLDPAGQGFWWLVSQPPLYVVGVGALFHLLVAPGIVADLEEAEGE